MAVRAKTVTVVKEFGDVAHVVVWSGLLNGDSGDPVAMPGSSDRSIQFEGTLGVGGTIVLEGSNEETPTNWHLLTDPQGNDISKTAFDLEAVTELTRWVRPRVTAGDGTTNLVATLFLKGNRRW